MRRIVPPAAWTPARQADASLWWVNSPATLFHKSLFLRHKNPTYFVGFLLCSETVILHNAVHRAACGVNPGSLIYPQTKKRKRRAVFVWRKTGRNRAREDLINNFFCDRMVSTLERHGGIRPWKWKTIRPEAQSERNVPLRFFVFSGKPSRRI